MSCRRPNYRYWIDKNDYWWRSDINDVAGGYAYGKEWESNGAASRRRVDQPIRFPDADDALLVTMLGFLDVSVVGIAAQINRRWRRAAGTCALWQRFVQLRWPDVWSGLAAPKALDARALYRRLACPQPWSETTPEGVLVLFELFVDGKAMVSATASLDEIRRQSAEAGLGDELRLRPRDAASYEKVIAQIDWAQPIQEREKHYGATLSLIRRDGAIVSSELEILGFDSEHHGIFFTGIVFPNHPLRSYARRRALCHQDENERRAKGLVEPGRRTPVKKGRGCHFGEQTHELTAVAMVSFDGRPWVWAEPEFPLASEHPEFFRPGDIAIQFQCVIWDGFHRTNEDGDYPLSDDEEDNGLVEWNGGCGPCGVKLDMHLLGGLEWPE